MHGTDSSWSELDREIRRRFRLRLREDRDWLEDMVQEAMLAMWRSHQSGEGPRDPVGFALTLLRRRYIDRLRRRRLRSTETIGQIDHLACPDPPRQLSWTQRLRESGLRPTPVWCQILDQLSSGCRTNKALSRILEKDPKSLRRARLRLQTWLEHVLSTGSAPPPCDLDIAFSTHADSLWTT